MNVQGNALYLDAGSRTTIGAVGAPGGTLAGLAKRGLRGVPTVAIKTPDDLAAAHEMMNGK